jgi:hypothetical protein
MCAPDSKSRGRGRGRECLEPETVKGSRNVVLCSSSPWWHPMWFLGSPAFRDRAFQCCGRRDGHAGRGGLPHENNLRRGQGVGLVDEVAEGPLQSHGFDGEGAGGRAEKLKSGKQKAEIARRRARHRAAASCRGYALRLTAMKRSPARTSVPQKHDILTNRPLSDPFPVVLARLCIHACFEPHMSPICSRKNSCLGV